MELVSAFEFSKGYKRLTLDAKINQVPEEMIVLDIFDKDGTNVLKVILDYAQAEMVVDSQLFVSDHCKTSL